MSAHEHEDSTASTTGTKTAQPRAATAASTTRNIVMNHNGLDRGGCHAGRISRVVGMVTRGMFKPHYFCIDHPRKFLPNCLKVSSENR